MFCGAGLFQQQKRKRESPVRGPENHHRIRKDHRPPHNKTGHAKVTRVTQRGACGNKALAHVWSLNQYTHAFNHTHTAFMFYRLKRCPWSTNICDWVISQNFQVKPIASVLICVVCDDGWLKAHFGNASHFTSPCGSVIGGDQLSHLEGCQVTFHPSFQMEINQ